MAFTVQQLERIRAVAMDMWEPYFMARSTCARGDGQIVHDRFNQSTWAKTGQSAGRKSRLLVGRRTSQGNNTIWLYRKTTGWKSPADLAHRGVV